ncbi:MAG: ChaN family lipoprotein [Burkholderiaceae bacterium]|nr:ChaN family lipoprotein [Burkholderiaceae bacterium]MDO9089398.1 ChaN family lipoprotein [Burkholderiaceae bacterium]
MNRRATESGPLALRLSLALTLLIAGCASAPAPELDALLPADVVLLGEQHDAVEHQRIHAQVVRTLAARGELAALALEMAPRGRSTAGLARHADEASVRSALAWNEQAWAWAAYAPAVMAAVRAGVPALGANLPREHMRQAMADAHLDAALPGPVLKAQQQAMRLGHCGLLPESQIRPMTRIQIARDQSMAEVVTAALAPGKTAVLLAGAGHVDKTLGVPRYLAPGLRVRAVRLSAGPAAGGTTDFDAVWTTPALPARDYCAELRPRP